MYAISERLSTTVGFSVRLLTTDLERAAERLAFHRVRAVEHQEHEQPLVVLEVQLRVKRQHASLNRKQMSTYTNLNQTKTVRIQVKNQNKNVRIQDRLTT